MSRYELYFTAAVDQDWLEKGDDSRSLVEGSFLWIMGSVVPRLSPSDRGLVLARQWVMR